MFKKEEKNMNKGNKKNTEKKHSNSVKNLSNAAGITLVAQL